MYSQSADLSEPAAAPLTLVYCKDGGDEFGLPIRFELKKTAPSGEESGAWQNQCEQNVNQGGQT